MKICSPNLKGISKNMTILGIDTCTETINVAVVKDGVLLSSCRSSAPRRQLTLLVPFIRETLEKSSLSIRDIELIALSTGPGSFTGIRLGISTAKTLAQVIGIPLAAVNTLKALAASCPEDGILVPSMDARKHEVFFAVIKKKGNILKKLGNYQRTSIDNYLSFINTMEYDNPVITGSIFWRYADRMQNEVGREYRIADESCWTPKAEAIAMIGEKLANEGKTTDYIHIQAKYLRMWEASPPDSLV